MFDFVIFTPTYDRAEMFTSIATQLRKEALSNKLRVCHIVVDDGSDFRKHRYQEICKKLGIREKNRYNILYSRNYVNFGKAWFYKTWNVMLKQAKELKFSYLIAMPDDHSDCAATARTE